MSRSLTATANASEFRNALIRSASTLAVATALVLGLGTHHAHADGAVLEPTTQRFIDTLATKGGPAIYTLSPADARNVLAGAQSAPVAKLPADIEAKTLPVGPTGKTKVYVVRPAGA